MSMGCLWGEGGGQPLLRRVLAGERGGFCGCTPRCGVGGSSPYSRRAALLPAGIEGRKTRPIAASDSASSMSWV